MVGGVSWDMVPAVPPELMLLPNWFAINIYEMSSWTRGIVIPLAILYAQKPHWPVPEYAHVEELFRDAARKALWRLRGTGAAFHVAQLYSCCSIARSRFTKRCRGSRCGSARCARRMTGCSNTWSAATGWRRFIRR